VQGQASDRADAPAVCAGPCRACGRAHALGSGAARAHAQALIRALEAHRRLDFERPAGDADPALSFDHLFPAGQGNMFGVLECRDAGGRPVLLRAFSSLRRGIREAPGWVPPLLSARDYYGRVQPGQRAIEALTREVEELLPDSPARRRLQTRRADASRALLADMQERYRFRNFRGECRSLREIFVREDGQRGIPGGVGECCAPKLLQAAVRRGLRPVGIAEFYWGGRRGSARLEHRRFYPACAQRCRPILGFLLCGLDDVGT